MNLYSSLWLVLWTDIRTKWVKEYFLHSNKIHYSKKLSIYLYKQPCTTDRPSEEPLYRVYAHMSSETLKIRFQTTYPRIINTSEAGLWFVQDKEGGQVGGVRCYNDHSKAGPHHAQYASRETAWSPLT